MDTDHTDIKIDKTDFLLSKKLFRYIYPISGFYTTLSNSSDYKRFFTMNSESESSLDTDQFTENITGTKKRTKGSRARARSGSATSKTDCDQFDNPQSEIVTVKQVRTNKTKWGGEKRKENRKRNRRTETKKQKEQRHVNSRLDRGLHVPAIRGLLS